MENIQDIIQKLKDLKPALQSEFAVKRIGVFGSFARGEAKPDSDIDILVELEKPIGWKFFMIEPFLQKSLGRKIDLVTEKAIRKEMKSQILSEVNFA
jgi:predicted nucleotidyltransferase